MTGEITRPTTSFEMEKAKQILKNEIGQKQYDDIIELSKPIAAHQYKFILLKLN